MQEAAAPLRAALEGDGLTRCGPRDGVTLFLCGDVMTAGWLARMLDCESQPLGTRLAVDRDACTVLAGP